MFFISHFDAMTVILGGFAVVRVSYSKRQMPNTKFVLAMPFFQRGSVGIIFFNFPFNSFIHGRLIIIEPTFAEIIPASLFYP